MRFSEQLRQLMSKLKLSQADLSNLTGIGKSSISQYVSGKNEPSKKRQKEIAQALGVADDYFEKLTLSLTETTEIQPGTVINLPVGVAASLMGKSKAWVAQGLQDGVFPWGYAVKLKNWSYYISSVKFTEFTGIEIPYNSVHELSSKGDEA